MTKNIIKQLMSVLLAVSMAFTALTGIPATKAQAATAKPVIKCSKVKIKNNSCTVKVGQKVNLTAKSGKTNITKKGTWKSSKKTVATISKTGKLTAKKAGTTKITITYKKKTSTKLKVVVKKKATATATPTPNPVESSKPDVTSSPTTTTKPVPGAYVVKYNPNGGTLSGSNTQSVTGEILEFPKVKAPSGKKFIGWYDKKSGGNRIYETYVPTKATELFAHYVDEDQKTQSVTFSLGCNYGYADEVTFMGVQGDGFDLTHKRSQSGPLLPFDSWADDSSMPYSDRVWSANYIANDDNTIVITDLPEPSIDGYTFLGWYTEPQYKTAVSGKLDGKKVKVGDTLKSDVNSLYARFSKKLTISFDDSYGGKYDDIEIATYGSVSDAGYELPVPKLPDGVTFKNWGTSFRSDYDGSNVVDNDTVFSNIIATFGYRCTECGIRGTSEDRLNSAFKHGTDWAGHQMDKHDGGFMSHNQLYLYEEVDHIVLYPQYERDEVFLEFDPKGGSLSKSYYDHPGLVIYDKDNGVYKKGCGYFDPAYAGLTYGANYYVGHENQSGWEYAGRDFFPKAKRDYYEFDGWYYLDRDGNEKEFTFDTMIEGNMHMYAKWKPGVSTVSFMSMASSGGFISDEERDAVGLDRFDCYEVPTESSIAQDEKRFPIPSNKDGRKFLGWVTYDDEPFTEDMPIIGTVELYAQWGSLPAELPIKLDFDPNGGTFDDETFENNISGLRGTAFKSFPSVSKPDCDFLGWYVLKPGATDYNDDASFIQMVGKTLSIKNDMVDDLGDDDDNNDKVTLVARWQPKGHAQLITMMGYNTDTYKTNTVENGESFDLQYDTTGEFLYQFRATVLPETIDNRDVIWSSSDPNIVYISGANADGEYVTRNNGYLTRLKFADGLTPTKEGYDVTLTARSADVASVTFTIKLHIRFPEDQIPVTVNFNAGEYGKFDDNGKRYQSKVYDVKRSKNLMSIIGSETPVLDFENTECFDSHGAAKYEFIGWEVITANGDAIDVTDDMKASDFNGLDEINIVAV